jgi:phosphatidylglycerophosphate synthase
VTSPLDPLPARAGRCRWIPNALSFSRGFAGLVVVALPLPKTVLLGLLIWGALSDFLDGLVARRFEWRTPMGGTIDLCADGLFFLCALAALWLRGLLPGVWLAVVLLGAVPELVAQGVLWVKGTSIGTLGHPIDKLLGGYSYFFVLGVALGFNTPLLCAGQVGLEVLANGRDLREALTTGHTHERQRTNSGKTP